MRKCILSYRVAKYLLGEGFTVIDVERSSKIKGNVVFIFDDSPQLTAALGNLPVPPRKEQ